MTPSTTAAAGPRGHVRDPKLADQGVNRIEWAEREMPVLRQIRARLGLSQRELARKLGIAKSTVSRWEAGVHPIDLVSERLILILAEEHDLKSRA